MGCLKMTNEKRLDLIDRNALIASCMAMLMTDVYPGWIKMPNKEKNIAGKISDTFKRIITGAPTVDAEPVVRGRWEERYKPNGEYVAWDGYYCSACGKQAAKSNYCPHCGAKMDGGNEGG